MSEGKELSPGVKKARDYYMDKHMVKAFIYIVCYVSVYELCVCVCSILSTINIY